MKQFTDEPWHETIRFGTLHETVRVYTVRVRSKLWEFLRPGSAYNGGGYIVSWLCLWGILMDFLPRLTTMDSGCFLLLIYFFHKLNNTSTTGSSITIATLLSKISRSNIERVGYNFKIFFMLDRFLFTIIYIVDFLLAERR